MNKEDLENLYETYELSIKNLTNKNKELQETIEELELENEKLVCEIKYGIRQYEDLQKTIDKAIEHIEEYCIDDEFYINLTNKEKHIFNVLDILKGEDND